MRNLLMKDEAHRRHHFSKIREDPTLTFVLGSQLKKARLEMGASTEAFAEALGLLPYQLISMENGLLRISAEEIYDAAQHCSKPIDYFFPAPNLLQAIHRT